MLVVIYICPQITFFSWHYSDSSGISVMIFLVHFRTQLKKITSSKEKNHCYFHFLHKICEISSSISMDCLNTQVCTFAYTQSFQKQDKFTQYLWTPSSRGEANRVINLKLGSANSTYLQLELQSVKLLGSWKENGIPCATERWDMNCRLHTQSEHGFEHHCVLLQWIITTVEKRIFSAILLFCAYLLTKMDFSSSTTGHRFEQCSKHTSAFMFII